MQTSGYKVYRIHPDDTRYTGYTFMQTSGYKVYWIHLQDTRYTGYTLRIQGILDTPLEYNVY